MTGVVTRADKGAPLSATDHDDNLEVMISLHKSATEPSPTYACMLWADTSTTLLKMRNSADSAWITLGDLDTAGAFSSSSLTDQDQLSELSDVTITSVADNEVLAYDSTASKWINQTASEAGLATSAQGSLADSALQDGDTVASLTITSADINGGTIDGVTIGGSSAGAGTFTNLTATGTASVAGAATFNSGNADVDFTVKGDNGNALFVDGGTNDISFYEDTGTTAKFFWDASAESLAVGDSSVDGDASALFLLGADPSGIEKGQLVLKGTATSGAADTGAALTFKGHNGSGNRGFGSIQVLKENSTVGNNDTYMRFSTRDNTDGYRETMRITSSGNVGIGTSSPSAAGVSLNVRGTSSTGGNRIASVAAESYDGLNHLTLYSGIGGTDVPSFVFKNGVRFAEGGKDTSSYTERMRIDSSGNLLVGRTSTWSGGGDNTTGIATVSSAGQLIVNATGSVNALVVNNTNTDNNIISIRQANTEEGSISVSGTTVSYNGGHLSRWSQLPDDSKDESIVKGTVMTNLDAMCEWSHENEYWTEEDELPVDEEGNPTAAVGDLKKAAFTEDNEQLNRMVVSSVEGDPNVAGVFVNWDNDDEFNDMNIAMTGDMVIRIAQGTTVARGDLLMSAGDGTAKPQGDDIVRSKTIAKVTSTHVSHTYDDGSYLVPCVLMAC